MGVNRLAQRKPIYTHMRNLPPSKMNFANIGVGNNAPFGGN
ncbi:hypothetical protein R84B8_01565 [Treponema sp. R8-4-B8]